MTRLEQVEHQLSYLLSLYEERKNDPSYKVQVTMLAAQRRNMLARLRPESRQEELID